MKEQDSPFLRQPDDGRPFDQRMRDHQIWWRREHIKSKEPGYQNRKCYEWILPSKLWEEGLWPGIRSGAAHSLPEYLRRNKVQKHQGAHNLKSSWMLCANLYFPFGATSESRGLLAGFLRQHVAAEIHSVDALELEYAEEGALSPSELLGEKGGSRGSGQTSPDLAFVVNGRRGLILTENKLVEHSFYRCSARRRTSSVEREGNPDPSRCEHASLVIQDSKAQCHQVKWGRKYWERLRVNEDAMSALRCCPAAYDGYQLFRQQALAEGIASSGKYDFVVSCVAVDARNKTLMSSLKTTGIADLRQDWPRLFNGKARFKMFEHQQWVRWVREHDSTHAWRDWLSYVEARYGYWQES